MATVRSLDDFELSSSSRGGRDGEDSKNTSSFTGGERSGLAVENPRDPSDDFISAIRETGPPPADARRVTLFKDGFCVDDGPFRPLGEAENDRFLSELKGGFAPRELQEGGRDVRVVLEDRRSSAYRPPPKPAYELFSGEGQTLGSPSSSSSAGPVDLEKNAVSVNEEERTTSLQFRFHNGQRSTQRFNNSHTIGDIHTYVQSAAPVAGGYRLVEGFPPKALPTDEKLSIESAGLLHSCITQQLC